ncbi:MAG: DUF1214 domain-containing protein [Gammaproteobacteria bacterium]
MHATRARRARVASARERKRGLGHAGGQFRPVVSSGPTAPDGGKSNWVPANPGGSFEVLFRFYGPGEPLFDKTWMLPDIEKVS